MAREEIPINPSLISWARKRAGFTLEEATEKFSHIEAWEAGSAFPTYPQLERLADEFRLPVAVFFFSEPPNVPPMWAKNASLTPSNSIFRSRFM